VGRPGANVEGSNWGWTVSQPTAPTFALLSDGSTVQIRPARAEDTGAVREMNAALSQDNFYLRFFSLNPGAADQDAKRICRDPETDHAALLAWQGDRLVGVASYEVTSRPDTAEVSFAVTDDMHGRGIAGLLLEHLVSDAVQHGLRAFTAETLRENSAMLRVFADVGLPARRRIEDDVVELTFPLPDSADHLQLNTYLDKVASKESRAGVASLRPLLQPRSIAVVGSTRHGTVGRAILHNIVTGGFAGPLYAVNPRAERADGVACVASVEQLPEQVDLAVIAVPPGALPGVATQCGQRGVRALIVITGGLGAAGPELLSICRHYGMRLVGPNCFGVIAPWARMDATFAADHPLKGVAGLVVQSGGVGIALLERLSRLGIGVSSFASTGDKYDVSPSDLLIWWAQDEVTQLAVLYVESFGNPRKFSRTARRVGQQMPVLTVVGGRSPAGQRAAASHTSAVATPLATQEALFGQAGVITTRSLGELIDTTALLACQPLPAGNRVAVVANAGGAGVLAADALGDHGLQVVNLSLGTQRELRRLLPDRAVVTGPVDTGPAVTTDTFRQCLEKVAADDGVDAILAVAVPTALSDLSASAAAAVLDKPLAVAFLDRVESVQRLRRRPVGPPAPPGHGDVAAEPGAILDIAAAAVTGVPAYADPDSAARALGHAVRYRAWLSRQHGKVPDLPGLRTGDARSLVDAFLADVPDGGWLAGPAAAELLSCYGIPVVTSLLAASADEAIAAARQLGGRVVLKAETEARAHKAGTGGVRLDLRTLEEVVEAYESLTTEAGRSPRVVVRPMLSGGVEVLIAVTQEPVFGPLILLGLGGVASEVVGDHVTRLTPLTDADADEMIRSVRGAPLLAGHQGGPAADTSALADVLLRVSALADDIPELTDLDLNPVLARPDGVHCVDVRVRIAPAEARDPFLRRLL
jgi:acyl-CoA synthetase (NDP forming)/GNAT superfamily N-acetyltransferase